MRQLHGFGGHINLRTILMRNKDRFYLEAITIENV